MIFTSVTYYDVGGAPMVDYATKRSEKAGKKKNAYNPLYPSSLY